jgi:hypothetical protein
LIDGNQSREIAINDTQKSMRLLRDGGLMMWKGFRPRFYSQFKDTSKAMQNAVTSIVWEIIHQSMSTVFWLKPSWILVGIKKLHDSLGSISIDKKAVR